MDKQKRAKLRAGGWTVGTPGDFLELSEEDAMPSVPSVDGFVCGPPQPNKKTSCPKASRFLFGLTEACSWQEALACTKRGAT